MFSYDNPKIIVRSISDPGANTKVIHLFKADQTYEVIKGYLTCQNAQGAGSAGAFIVLNYGTAGTSNLGTVCSSAGGTAVADRLSAATPKELTISEGTLAKGDWVTVGYTETGDWVEGQVTIQLNLVNGIGA